jgi:putative endonuclease
MSTGSAGEDLVLSYYRTLGYKLLERNYRNNFGKQLGEIDIILMGHKELVFVEVKTRSNKKFGLAADAVDQDKQRKIVNMVKYYRQQHSEYNSFNFRIDVATVDIDNSPQPVIILPNAIEDLD